MSLFQSRLPLLQAPMAGVQDYELASAVAQAGGIGALPCAMWDGERIVSEVQKFRARAGGDALNLNFFCHEMAEQPDFSDFQELLKPYLDEYGLKFTVDTKNLRRPFDEKVFALVLKLKPEFVSFHFGLPAPGYIEELKSAGIKVLGTATTLREAKVLETKGVDAIILQGIEAGGHRGMFEETTLESQIPSFDLLAECQKKIARPLILAGGIRSPEAVQAALAKGAAGVQVGTAFLRSQEIKVSPVHRAALNRGGETDVTRLLTGRYARGLQNRFMREVGSKNPDVPPFPYPACALAQLKEVTEQRGESAFTALWAGTQINFAKTGRAQDIVEELFSLYSKEP